MHLQKVHERDHKKQRALKTISARKGSTFFFLFTATVTPNAAAPVAEATPMPNTAQLLIPMGPAALSQPSNLYELI